MSAVDPFVLTDAMPFSAPDFDSYISLDKMISPFPAFKLKKNFPFVDVFSSNLPAIKKILP
jgi:hypothetical protein